MEQYEKPNMEIIVLTEDVITKSGGCPYECGTPGSGTIETPPIP